MAVKRSYYEAIDGIINIFLSDREYLLTIINQTGGNEGWSPLHIAAFQNSYRVVGLLLQNGSDIFLRNKCGNTALNCV